MKVRKNESCESIFLIAVMGNAPLAGKYGKLNRRVSIGGDFGGKLRRLPRWRPRAAGVSVPQGGAWRTGACRELHLTARAILHIPGRTVLRVAFRGAERGPGFGPRSKLRSAAL